MNDTIWAAVMGGLLAIGGGLAAAWFQSRITRRMRMNSVIGEKKVKANAEAYQHLREIEQSLIQRSDAETLALMNTRDAWLAANRLFLPDAFADNWLSLRTTVQWLVGGPLEGPLDADNIHRLRMKALKLVKDAQRKVYRDMGVEEARAQTAGKD